MLLVGLLGICLHHGPERMLVPAGAEQGHLERPRIDLFSCQRSHSDLDESKRTTVYRPLPRPPHLHLLPCLQAVDPDVLSPVGNRPCLLLVYLRLSGRVTWGKPLPVPYQRGCSCRAGSAPLLCFPLLRSSVPLGGPRMTRLSCSLTAHRSPFPPRDRRIPARCSGCPAATRVCSAKREKRSGPEATERPVSGLTWTASWSVAARRVSRKMVYSGVVSTPLSAEKPGKSRYA